MSYKTDHFDDETVRLLKSGGTGLVPADTIYGLSCMALNENAVKRLHQIKKREADKPFIVLICRTSQLEGLGLTLAGDSPVLRYWPGRLTVILKSSVSPKWLEMGTGSLAVRLPANKELLGLIEKTGPLVSTSANLAGGEPAQTAAQAQDYFGDALDFYVDVGKLSGQPSTLVQPVFGKLKIVRQGSTGIKKQDLA